MFIAGRGYGSWVRKWVMSGSSVLRESLIRLSHHSKCFRRKLKNRCNNQVGKVEEGHINRNAVLRSTTTWPNERVSMPVHTVS